MRLLLGIIIGIGLTIGGAYLHDSGTVTPQDTATQGTAANSARPMVNWDVVETTWHNASSRVRQEWDRLAAK